MCYNKDVSLDSFIVGIGLSLILYHYGDKYDKHISVFFIVIALMQLAEYFMWIDQNCGKINHYASLFAELIIYLQIVVVISAGYYFNTFTGFINKIISKYIIYACLFIWLLVNLSEKKRRFCSKETSTGHLKWDFKLGPIKKNASITHAMYYILLILPWLFLKDRFKGRLLFSILLLPLLYFRFNFYHWESLWCLFSVYAPIVFLLLCKFKECSK